MPRGGVPANSSTTQSVLLGVRGNSDGSIRGVDGVDVRGSRCVHRVSVFGAALFRLLSIVKVFADDAANEYRDDTGSTE